MITEGAKAVNDASFELALWVRDMQSVIEDALSADENDSELLRLKGLVGDWESAMEGHIDEQVDAQVVKLEPIDTTGLDRSIAWLDAFIAQG